jgi:dTDP-4-amino-4,6-dideoxygalactose transaminase
MADRADVESPEVLIPAYGCPDLVAAVVAQGATPVVVDLADQQTPRMDTESVAAAITSNTVAVIAVDFLGIPERLDALSAICQANNLLLI